MKWFWVFNVGIYGWLIGLVIWRFDPRYSTWFGWIPYWLGY